MRWGWPLYGDNYREVCKISTMNKTIFSSKEHCTPLPSDTAPCAKAGEEHALLRMRVIKEMQCKIT